MTNDSTYIDTTKMNKSKRKKKRKMRKVISMMELPSIPVKRRIKLAYNYTKQTSPIKMHKRN